MKADMTVLNEYGRECFGTRFVADGELCNQLGRLAATGVAIIRQTCSVDTPPEDWLTPEQTTACHAVVRMLDEAAKVGKHVTLLPWAIYSGTYALEKAQHAFALSATIQRWSTELLHD